MPDVIEAPPAPSLSLTDEIRSALESGKFDDKGNVIETAPPALKPEEVAPPVPETPKPEEAKPTEEKKPEEADPEIPEAPESLSEKAKADWGAIKETARNYKAKVIAAEALIEAQKQEFAAKEAEWQKKIEEASSTSGELVELRQKREAFEAAEKEFSVYAVTKTADYQRTIAAPLRAIEERAVAIAKKAEVSSDTLLDAISELDDDKQAEMLETVVAGLSSVDGARVLRMAEDARGLILRDIEIKENAHAAQKELKEREEKEAGTRKETATKEFKASVKNTIESLSQRLPFVELADGETKEGVFKSILDKAEAEDFDAATPATKGTAAVSVLMLERATRQLQKLADENKLLKERVAEANLAAPSLGGDPPPPPPPKPGGSLQDEVNAFLKLGKSRSADEILKQGY